MEKEIDKLMKEVALGEEDPGTDHPSTQEGSENDPQKTFRDRLDSPPDENKPRFSLGENRKKRIQIMVTEKEFQALESKLGRRESISDYCRNRMKESGFFDEPNPTPEP